MKNAYSYDTAIGRIGLAEEGGAITDLLFPGRSFRGPYIEAETPVLEMAARQLYEYFSGRRTVFDLPLTPAGTPFQRRVWDALLNIPYGETRSYLHIATQVGNPAACRAVGAANGKNPIAIFIPCHRVIGADGSLVGFGGGLHIKEHLLRLEGIMV